MKHDRRTKERIVISPGKKFSSQEFDQLIIEFNAIRDRKRKEKFNELLKIRAQINDVETI